MRNIINILLKTEKALRVTLTFIASLVVSFLIVAVGMAAITAVWLLLIAVTTIIEALITFVLFPIIIVAFTIGFACVLTAAYTED